MTVALRLAWVPMSTAPAALVQNQVSKYLENSVPFAQFANGSCLMLKPLSNIDEVIRGCMEEAKLLPDFKVYAMEDGDYLVNFSSALMVYVGKQEFEQREAELRERIDELKFHGEEILTPPSSRSERETLVGLYGRAKLQRDAYGHQPYVINTPSVSN